MYCIGKWESKPTIKRWNLTFNWSKDNNVCYVRILQKFGQTRNIWWKQWNWRDISPLIDLHRVCETYKHSQRISAWTGFYSSIMIIPVNNLFIGLRNFPWSSTRTPMDITLVLHKIEMTNLLKFKKNMKGGGKTNRKWCAMNRVLWGLELFPFQLCKMCDHSGIIWAFSLFQPL